MGTRVYYPYPLKNNNNNKLAPQRPNDKNAMHKGGALFAYRRILDKGVSMLHFRFILHFKIKQWTHRSDLHVKHPGPHSYSTMAETENTEGD